MYLVSAYETMDIPDPKNQQERRAQAYLINNRLRGTIRFKIPMKCFRNRQAALTYISYIDKQIKDMVKRLKKWREECDKEKHDTAEYWELFDLITDEYPEEVATISMMVSPKTRLVIDEVDEE